MLFADYIKFDPKTFDCYIFCFEIFFQFHRLKFDFYIKFLFLKLLFVFLLIFLIKIFYLSNLVIVICFI